jgi:hypothetical protein
MSNNPKFGGSLVTSNPGPVKNEFGATPDRLGGPRGSSLVVGQHTTINDAKQA